MELLEDLEWLRQVLPDMLAIATIVASYPDDGVDGTCIGCRAKRRGGDLHLPSCVWLKAKQVVGSAVRRGKLT